MNALHVGHAASDPQVGAALRKVASTWLRLHVRHQHAFASLRKCKVPAQMSRSEITAGMTQVPRHVHVPCGRDLVAGAVPATPLPIRAGGLLAPGFRPIRCLSLTSSPVRAGWSRDHRPSPQQMRSVRLRNLGGSGPIAAQTTWNLLAGGPARSRPTAIVLRQRRSGRGAARPQGVT